MSFAINQKIVCIDNSPGDAQRYPQYRLTLGSVYTVTDKASFHGAPYIRVAELDMPAHTWVRANRFRPLREVSIEIFRNILLPNSEELA